MTIGVLRLRSALPNSAQDDTANAVMVLRNARISGENAGCPRFSAAFFGANLGTLVQPTLYSAAVFACCGFQRSTGLRAAVTSSKRETRVLCGAFSTVCGSFSHSSAMAFMASMK